MPEGVPQEVVETLDRSGRTRSPTPRRSQKYAKERGAVFAPYYGEEAQKRVAPAVRTNAWLMFDGGKAKVDP